MYMPLNLKEIERKAFRSTYQDGLLDLSLGLDVVFMSLFLFHPAEGYSVANIFLMLCVYTIAGGLFLAGKMFITLPRMGQVRFGAGRKRKITTLAIILGVIVAIQAGIVGLTVLGRENPEVGAKVSDLFNTGDLGILLVAALSSLFVGPSMILIAYFIDFPRGYYIAIMMSLAVFLMILLNQPIYPVVIGGLIVLPGLVLFVRFLKKYPLPGQGTSRG